MDYPQFKYHPNAYTLDLFEQVEGICDICNQARDLRYDGPFYSVDEPDYMCPWFIENGTAAEKFEGSFFDLGDIEGAVFHLQEDGGFYFSHDIASAETEIIQFKTPSYSSWQQQVWLTHCQHPCKFIAYATSENIKTIYAELATDIQQSNVDEDQIQNHMHEDGWFKGYLFQCVHCEKHRLHIDCC